jgi:hypothetical protein
MFRPPTPTVLTFTVLALLTLIQPMHTMDLEVAADGSASPPTSPPSAPTPPPSAAASAVPPPPTGPTYTKQLSGTPSSSALITTLAECEAAASILGVSYVGDPIVTSICPGMLLVHR